MLGQTLRSVEELERLDKRLLSFCVLRVLEKGSCYVGLLTEATNFSCSAKAISMNPHLARIALETTRRIPAILG